MDETFAAAVHFQHAVALGIRHDITENGGALAPRRRLGHELRQAVAVENIIAEDQSDIVGADEVAADDECIGKPARLLLHGITERQAELRPVAQQRAKKRLIVRRGDDQNIADAGKHQRRQRIIDHRLVVDRQQLLGKHQRHRM